MRVEPFIVLAIFAAYILWIMGVMHFSAKRFRYNFNVQFLVVTFLGVLLPLTIAISLTLE